MKNAWRYYPYIWTCVPLNEDHMIYGSWNIRCNRQKFLSFWAILCPFSPLTTWKIKILKLKKTPGYIIIFHICTINDNHMCMVSEIWSATDIIFCNSGPFFALLNPNKQNNQHFEKMKKLPVSFYTCVPKMTIIWYMVPEILSAMDRIFWDFGLVALLPL